MLGETYEYVSENFRVVAEKIQHTPEQISALHMEGKGYKVWAYEKPIIQFKFGGGKGMVDILPKGFNEVYLEKYDEFIVLDKCMFHGKNVIFGGMYVDSTGQCVSLNTKTGAKLVVDFHEKVNS
jgi:hypothetical protein